MDLPHASSLWPSQTPVSVIIRCKTPYFMSVENTARTLKYGVCSDTPRFSYSVSKLPYVHVPVVTATVCVHRAGRRPCWSTGPGCRQGGYTGWVYRVGNTGVSLRHRALLEEQALTAKRARSPCRGRSGGQGAADVQTVPWTQPQDHHSAPVVLRARSAVLGLLGAAPGLGTSKGEISS